VFVEVRLSCPSLWVTAPRDLGDWMIDIRCFGTAWIVPKSRTPIPQWRGILSRKKRELKLKY